MISIKLVRGLRNLTGAAIYMEAGSYQQTRRMILQK
jgi:hypothetical protein